MKISDRDLSRRCKCLTGKPTYLIFGGSKEEKALWLG
jgi:hypothetical protein